MIGALLLVVGLATSAGVGSDSPEDRWRNDKETSGWFANLEELALVGASELWVIVDNSPEGDGKNSSPWRNGDPEQGVDHDWLEQRAAWASLANSAGVRVELALWEQETFPRRSQARRLELARAAAAAFRGLDVLICLSEEAPSRTSVETYIELAAAIHEVDPGARVTIHNEWAAADEQRLLGGLAVACWEGRIRLWGVSGQAQSGPDAGRFLREWQERFPGDVVVRVTEIGPFPGGIAKSPTRDHREYFWAAALHRQSARIYKGAFLDLERDVPSVLPWSEAYRQAAVAQWWGNVGDLMPEPWVVRLDGHAATLRGEDGGLREVRIWWSDGDGPVELPAGRWLLERVDTRSGDRWGQVEWFSAPGGVVRIERGPGQANTDWGVVLRSEDRVREVVLEGILGLGPGLDVNGDGRVDSGDMLSLN